MILSASRRTDIPAFYSEWFVNRLKAGHVLVPNPYYLRQLSYVSLSPERVDCIVFWTKNASPMLERLKEMERLGYKDYYFEFTVTPYDAAIESRLPPKSEVVRTFQQLSDRIGPARVDWRFDPILLRESISECLILDAFEDLCKQLANYTERCIFSFVDVYRSIRPSFQEIPSEKKAYMAKLLAEIAAAWQVKLYACSEAQAYSSYGIYPSACIDKEKIEQIIGCPLRIRKDPSQRKLCQCIESVDMGMYNTCRHGCIYCYANSKGKPFETGNFSFDPLAPMLTGYPTGMEVVKERKTASLKDPQGMFR